MPITYHTGKLYTNFIICPNGHIICYLYISIICTNSRKIRRLFVRLFHVSLQNGGKQMTVWRMSFRVGKGGPSIWRECFELGVAAITYNSVAETDLSKYPKREPKELWAELENPQKASLRHVAYDMRKGDIIYVKKGPEIICRGVVQGSDSGSYRFDSDFRIRDHNGTPWAHQVPVEWESDFPKLRIFLGTAQQFTVQKLDEDELQMFAKQIETARKIEENAVAEEGEAYKAEAIFRQRNRLLIQIKKERSDYNCEVCGFNFKNFYGDTGKKYIVAHHTKPVALGTSRTTLADIALVCANCHAMIHARNPLTSVTDLRNIVEKKMTNDKTIK